jgi:hypothetical protein
VAAAYLLPSGDLLQGRDHRPGVGQSVELELFDVAKLKRLDAYQIEWVGDDGLFIRVCEDVREAATPTEEAEMIRLTEVMRCALRKRPSS